MEFNEQIYRAPSLPKISRRNISSPVIRGAQSVVAPKLKKSTFSFVKPRINATALKTDTETSISETLDETNRILVEIQKQLSLDFANRITEKKDALKSAKIRLNKERASRKEESLESGKPKEGGFRPFDKVKQRVKSIFEKILDFFTIIATGLIVNNAFNWISKKENREKVKQFFDFVGKYWKELLALFIGFKITKFILRLKRLVDLFGKGPKGGGPKGGTPLDCAGVMKCFSTSVVPFLAANPRVVNQMGQSLLKDRRFLTGLATALGIAALPSGSAPVKPTPTTSPTPTAPSSPTSQSNPSNWSSGIWATLAAAGYTTIEIIKALSAVGMSLAGAEARAEGGTIESPTKCTACSLGFSGGGTLHASDGMTVPGGGSGLIDSVKAMLAPGEEVIRTAAAMLFRPLLKDINNNAGRKWIEFSTAIKNVVKYNSTMIFALDE